MKNQQLAKFQIDLTATAVQRELPPGIARIYGVNLFQAGTPNGWTVTPTVIAPAVLKWEGIEVMLDHAGMADKPSTRNLVGMIRNPAFDGAKVSGELHVLNLSQSAPAIELLDLILSMRAQGQTPPRVGMSTDLYLSWEKRGETRAVLSIDQVSTADIVVHPAAGGEINRAIMQQQTGGNTMSNEPNETTTPAPAPAPEQPKSQAQFAGLPSALAQAEAQATAQLQEQCTRLLDLKLSASGLPAPMCEIVRAHFQDANGQVKLFQPVELDGEIERTKTAHAQMSAQNAIRDMGQPVKGAQRKPIVTGMWDSLERITAAYERLMGLPVKAEFSEVPRLTGIRELYFQLTGDRELRGMFKPERVQFAVTGATTPIVASTMNDITADVLNKIAMQSWNTWSQAGYNWYKRCTAKKDSATLQDVKWMTPAGFANLAAVNEGAIYPELTWSDVQEHATFVKKGGYLPLTIEMIDKDETESWRQVGAYLGMAAIRTLSAYVAAIFTTNAVLHQDGVALFDAATHANLIGYDLDETGWDAAGQAIFDQGEVGSTKALGLTPDRVLIPREKRKQAIKLFFSDREPGGSLNDINVAALDKTKDGEGPIIVVPDWTDADNWVAMVDPALYPGVGVAYRFGDTPEIFSAANANDFLLFYQDCLPIKVRFFFAAAAIDYRPMVLSSI